MTVEAESPPARRAVARESDAPASRPSRSRLRPITAHGSRPTRRSLRRRRILVVFSATVLFAVLFSAAALQVVLIGNQRRLDALQARISDAREQQYNLRRQETLLRSPQDVADIATTQLGMVAPEGAVLVAPAPLLIGVPTTTIPPTTIPPATIGPATMPAATTPVVPTGTAP